MSVTVNFLSRGKLEDLGRWHINGFVRQAATSIPAGSRVLDAGAGESAYRALFNHCRYVAADLAVGDSGWNYRSLSVLSRLEMLPFGSGVFDAVLCTQALEHLEWPRECVKEMFRTLRPGGQLFLTAPMAHPEHQIPYDFFRYTSFGLLSVLRGAGFTSVSVEPFGGLFTRLAYELPRILTVFPSSGLFSGRLRLDGIALLPVRILAHGLVHILQKLFLSLERYDREKNDPFGWAVVARK